MGSRWKAKKTGPPPSKGGRKPKVAQYRAASLAKANLLQALRTRAGIKNKQKKRSVVRQLQLVRLASEQEEEGPPTPQSDGAGTSLWNDSHHHHHPEIKVEVKEEEEGEEEELEEEQWEEEAKIFSDSEPIAIVVTESLGVEDDPLGEDDGGGGGVSRCLVCYKECPPPVVVPRDFRGWWDQVQPTHYVLFILKRILEISEEEVEGILELEGDPNKWIAVCEPCQRSVQDFMTANDKIVDELETLRMIRNRIVRKIKTSSGSRVCEADKDESVNMEVTNVTRGIVRQRNYDKSNSIYLMFPNGLKERSVAFESRTRFGLAKQFGSIMQSTGRRRNGGTFEDGVREVGGGRRCGGGANSKGDEPSFEDDHDDEDFTFSQANSAAAAVSESEHMSRSSSSVPCATGTHQSGGEKPMPPPPTPSKRSRKTTFQSHSSQLSNKDYGQQQRPSSSTSSITKSAVAVAQLPSSIVSHCISGSSSNPTPATSPPMSALFARPRPRNLTTGGIGNPPPPPKTYQCNICPSSKDMDIQQFVSHLVFHLERPLKCFTCQVFFPNDKSVREDHLKKFHPGKGAEAADDVFFVARPDSLLNLFKCHYCTAGFPTDSQRNQHSIRAHKGVVPIKRLFCKLCMTGFPNDDELMIHKALAHPEVAKYGCLKCDEIFKKSPSIPDTLDESNLRKHLDTVHNSSTSTTPIPIIQMCPLCGVSFGGSKGSSLERKAHIKTAHYLFVKAVYPCQLCPATFPSAAKLKEHGQGHPPSSSSSSSRVEGEGDGESRLLLWQDLEGELVQVTPNQFSVVARVNQCWCGQVFDTKVLLRSHKAHQHLTNAEGGESGGGGGVMMMCDICGWTSSTSSNSNNGASGLASHKYKEHQIIPEGIEVLKCASAGCTYTTLKRERFVVHSRTHLPMADRPYSCSTCGKKFTDNKKRQVHEQIHANAESKPYQCELCGASFAVKNYLYIHKRLSHEKRVFPSTNKKKSTVRSGKGLAKKKKRKPDKNDDDDDHQL